MNAAEFPKTPSPKPARIPPQTPPAGGTEAEAGRIHIPSQMFRPAESALVFRVLRKMGSDFFKQKPLLRSSLMLGATKYKHLYNYLSTKNEVKRRSVLCSLGRSRTTAMYYIYIIQSLKDESFYIGSTEDLKRRLQEHNRGEVRYTSSKIPYRLVWYCAFRDKKKALVFEKYLKQGSGFAFTKKHLV